MSEKHVFQRGGRIYDQMCGLCNAVADAPIHQMGDIQRAQAETVNHETEVKREVDRREVLKVINAQVLASHNLGADPHNFVINQGTL